MKAQLTHPATLQMNTKQQALIATLLKIGVALLLAYTLGAAMSNLDMGTNGWSAVSTPANHSAFTA